MFLTGRPDGPPLPAPDGFVGRLRAVGDVVARRSAELGRPVDIDVLALLGERAALAGLHRRGDVSCGGSARLLPAAGGWLVVNLPRPEDVDLLPAWLAGLPFRPEPGRAGDPEPFTRRNGGHMARSSGDDVWKALGKAIAGASPGPLAERAHGLGLPVAELARRPPLVPPAAEALEGLPVIATAFGGDQPAPALERLVVVDLSSLWAGPLCSHLLQRAGARVVKVESVHRPDGARLGPPAFFDLLHAGQQAVALDFRTDDGRAGLQRLLRSADVVVEGSRPRALEQLRIRADEILAEAAETGAGPKIWVSVTGYGRTRPGRDRVAFGDDAAVAGGLVARDAAGPCFLADAVADPCAGLVAAAAVLSALAAGRRRLLDVAMAAVAADLAGPGPEAGAMPPPEGLTAEAPRARPVTGRAPGLGAHTEAVLSEVGGR
ncbi:MAG: CoA transferase [Actinobacteria bacterium]|nr:CoA transferase [Actinomycetota bacterium]